MIRVIGTPTTRMLGILGKVLIAAAMPLVFIDMIVAEMLGATAVMAFGLLLLFIKIVRVQEGKSNPYRWIPENAQDRRYLAYAILYPEVKHLVEFEEWTEQTFLRSSMDKDLWDRDREYISDMVRHLEEASIEARTIKRVFETMNEPEWKDEYRRP